MDMTPRFWPSWRRNLPQATINRRPAWQVVEERKRQERVIQEAAR